MPQADATAAWRVLDGVLQQVDDDSCEHVRSDQDRREPSVDLDDDRHAVVGGLDFELIGGFAQEPAEIRFHHVP